ncbi:hypothetical protein, partial [Bradyrhizobium sp.]|uniref:hypothetical protein n=1 Tax=Bradyrhizobium sp. TaxID=376 RepID=UPI003C16A16E
DNVAPSARGPCFTELLEELMHFGRLSVDRRQGFRREVVDFNDLGHLVRRRHLMSFGLRDDARRKPLNGQGI